MLSAEHMSDASTETSAAGRSTTTRFLNGVELSLDERKELDLSTPGVAGKYLEKHGGRVIPGVGLYVLPDGYYALTTDNLDSTSTHGDTAPAPQGSDTSC